MWLCFEKYNVSKAMMCASQAIIWRKYSLQVNGGYNNEGDGVAYRTFYLNSKFNDSIPFLHANNFTNSSQIYLSSPFTDFSTWGSSVKTLKKTPRCLRKRHNISVEMPVLGQDFWSIRLLTGPKFWREATEPLWGRRAQLLRRSTSRLHLLK